MTLTFREASRENVDDAAEAARAAFDDYQVKSPRERAAFLDRIAEEIVALGEDLITRANAETALPEARLTGERARTVGQLKMFAELIREGSWVEASIDRSIADRTPLPKPDLRRMLVPLGPVAVFGASNFPLAFSVAGGDTASALASGCPVVVKAHPAHPGTSELTARAVCAAVKATDMPVGVFSMLHGGPDAGMHLVKHAAIKAVGFTGSLRGGRAIFDGAAARAEPIPVYAEMGSTNPIFILPRALAARGGQIAEGFIQSVTLGVGQFCTNPGLAFGLAGQELETFITEAGRRASEAPAGTMLYDTICRQYADGSARFASVRGVRVAGKTFAADVAQRQAAATVFSTDAATFLENEDLREELFGPATVIVGCGSSEEMMRVARELPGQLTVTIHGTEEDLKEYGGLIHLLRQKAGRLIINGFPTGVEVCASMQHGGPYPATTDSRTTSVGTQAIKRFARPVCFQSFPDRLLPEELRNRNTRGIWRLIDNQFTRDNV